MKLPEIGRLEGGIEDGSSRWTTQGLRGCGIHMIEHERVGLRKWFTALKREPCDGINRA